MPHQNGEDKHFNLTPQTFFASFVFVCKEHNQEEEIKTEFRIFLVLPFLSL
jgi:hypothetical protein